MSKNIIRNFNDLPDLSSKISSLDYQDEMIFLLHYLLDEGLATQAGRYVTDKSTKPLFRHNNLAYTDEKQVESIDKGRGAELLKSLPTYLKDPVKCKKLMTWIVAEFSVLKESAISIYKNELKEEDFDDEKHLVHIIAGAAHHLAFINKTNTLITSTSDKIQKLFKLSIIGFGLFLYLALVYFYYANQTIIHPLFAGLSFFIALSTLFLMILLKTKFRLKALHLRYGLANIALALSITIHQLFVFFYMLPPHQRHEMPFAVFGASFILLPVFLLCVMVNFYLLAYTLIQTNNNAPSHRLYQLLNPYVDKVTDKFIALIIFVSFALLAGANLSFLFKQLF